MAGQPPHGRTMFVQALAADSALVERHRPVLEVLADPRHITHVGGHGAGYLAKLLVNLLWFGQAIATAEAQLLARRAGLDLDVLRQALTGSAASSVFIRDHLGALLADDYLTSFGLDRCCEELAAVTACPGPLRSGRRGTARGRAAGRTSRNPAAPRPADLTSPGRSAN
jgi:3-hydroxyisobutyrate dehydrogenase-like beta-hydroxyacid dehydrogenase